MQMLTCEAIHTMRNILMTTSTSQPTVPPANESKFDELKVVESQKPENSDFNESCTPDGYDAHIIPSETAARKEREGDNFKHLAEHPPGSESLDTTGGFTLDKEGLIDNFGIEPEMYYETPGDAQKESHNESELQGN
jgi:hypothetical protein